MRDLSYCRVAFPSLERTGSDGQPLVFLDGPGGSQVPASVITAISEYYLQHNANTHGQFITSRESDQIVEHARADMMAFLGAKRGTISFGQNMTTLNFLLSQAIAEEIQPGDEIVVSDLDHDSNVAPWLRLASRGAIIRHVPVLQDGTLDLEAFRELIGPKTRLVAVGWASNAVGTVNPVSRIREWTREVGATLVVDAVHWAPHGPIDVDTLQPDFLLCSAYKFFGPHIGILYASPGSLDRLNTLRVRPQVPIAPEKMETGTLNHAALAGVSKAVEFVASLVSNPRVTMDQQIHQAMKDIYAYEHDLAGHLAEGLSNMSSVTLYGPPVADADRAPTISFAAHGRSSQDIAQRLGDRGILVWDGDFYAQTLVDHLGLRGQGGLVRLGLAPYNTRGEIDRTLATIQEVLDAP